MKRTQTKKKTAVEHKKKIMSWKVSTVLISELEEYLNRNNEAFYVKEIFYINPSEVICVCGIWGFPETGQV